jgi:translation initiation factor IF-2
MSESERKTILIPSILTVKQLADLLDQPVTTVIGKLMSFGVLATINEDIDFDTAAIVTDDFGFNAIRQKNKNEEEININLDNTAQLENRPPIVSIMGHVDHGKTTLLDTIRKTNVAEKEAGGITQHISSYQIEIAPKDGSAKRLITFLDTPGHSAFEAMRRHGARITDLVVLVVAADDGVKPQTLEAIKHAKQMKVPIMVAINKIDKPQADIERTKSQLAELDLVPEEWGGKTVVALISAKQNIGIPELLELIFLSTDLRDLKANFKVPAVGVVIESHLQAGIGPVASILVQNGTLKIGDFVSIGNVSGKVRTLTDFKGKKILEATPSTPVEISGLSDLPKFGEQLTAFATEKEARDMARDNLRRQTVKKASSGLNLSAHTATRKEDGKNILNLIIKADTNGSLEAIRENLSHMKNDDLEVRLVSDGVGDISEGDISMASTAKALVIGFQVRIPAAVKSLADRENIAISLFNVIYELFDSVTAVLQDMMPVVKVERQVGELRIIARFRDNKKNIVIGGMLEEGTLEKGQAVRISHNREIITEGKIITLRHGREEVKQAKSGSEYGLELEVKEVLGEVQAKDILTAFVIEESTKPLNF